MNNNTIFYFSLINVKKDDVTVERVELYNNNFDRPRKFKLNNGILNSLLNDKGNLFVGWDNREQFNSLKPKAPYLDYCKAYSKIILNNIDDCRSLTELKQTYDIKNMSDTQAMQLIDNKKKITDKIMELMKTTGIGNPNKVLFPSACLESYIAKNKVPIKSNNDNTNKGYNLGGLNIIGKNKQYKNLKHFDINSMYPNILISLQASSNLDYLNLKCSTVKELTGDWELINETKSTAFYMQKNGLKQARFKNGEYKILELDSKFDLTEANNDIANLVEELLQYKENNTGNLRTAYKTLVNGLSGALDSIKHFKYKHHNLMSIATFIGRYILYNCYKEFNGVYAKTDSIWTTNKNITEEDLNNYSNDLLNRIGIPNSCISWELESEPDKLLIKDSNTYIEVIGDDYDFKGGCEAPIQEIALKKAIENKLVYIKPFFNEYKKEIPLFCKHLKYSTSQENQDRFNKVLTEIKGYTIEPDKKCYQYFSIHGWVNGLEIDQFNLKVDEDYGLNLITKILHDYGFRKTIGEFNITEKYEAPKFVPMILKYGENRLIQDNSRLDILFRTNTNNYPIVERLQKLILPCNANYQYIGFIVGTNYYVIDIDTGHKFDVETVKDEILKLFDKNQYILQSSKSNGYHIIFKTDNDLTGFERTSTIEGYKGLELLRNKLVPYNNKYSYKNKQYEYKIIDYDRGNANDVIDALYKLEPFNKTDELKRFYVYDETKKTKDIIPVNDNVKDFQELDKLTSQIVELSKHVKNNRHDYCISIGASLKGHISKNDIIFIATALDPIIDSTNVKNTITWAYDTAEPTKSLGHLNNYIKKSNNQKELKEVFKMIEETIKTNEINNVMDMNNQETDNNIVIESIAKSIAKNKHDFKQLKKILYELKYNPDVVETIFNEIHEFYQEREQEIINKFLEISNVNTVDTLYKTYKLQIKGIARAEEEIDEAHSDAVREENEYLVNATEFAQRVLDKLVVLCNIMSITKDYIYSCFAKSLLTLGYDRRALTGEIYRFTETGWEHIPLDIFKANVNEVYNNNVSDKDIGRVLQYLNTLPNPNYNMVQFLNGQYNMVTHEFKETDKEIFPLLKIPYNYNPNAEPTYIHNFLNSSLPNYELKTILEVIGWLFTSGNEEQKCYG